MRCLDLIGGGLVAICTASSGGQTWTNPATGHNYSITPEAMSWFQAETYAQSVGGRLAAINDAKELTWILSTIPLPPDGSAGGFDPAVWLGGSDAAAEGTWTWTTGELWAFTNWAPGEPNDNTTGGGPNGEDYLVMYTVGAQLGLWNDADAEFFGSHPLRLYGLVEVVPAPTAAASLIAGFLLHTRRRR